MGEKQKLIWGGGRPTIKLAPPLDRDKHRLEQEALYWRSSSKRKEGEITLLNNRIRGYRGLVTKLMGEIAKLKRGSCNAK